MKQSGFIALTAVLVLSVLMLALVVSTISHTLKVTQSRINTELSGEAAALAYACSEYALIEVMRNLHYTGDETLYIGDGQCTIGSITEEPAGARVIHTTGIVEDYTHRVIVEVGTLSPTVDIDTYQSVATF